MRGLKKIFSPLYYSLEDSSLIRKTGNILIVSTSWLDVAKLAFDVSRRGHNPPLADLYIANCAIKNKLSLITRDRHFQMISAVNKISLKLI